MSLLQIEGTQNFRDTGGTSLAGGGATRSGVLFRSEALSALTERGIAQFATTDVGVVVDLRTETEREMSPNRLPDSAPIDTLELPLLEGALTGLARGAMTAADPAAAKVAVAQALALIPSLGQLYVSMLDSGATSFARLARLVAASGDAARAGVLVHCTAGKDRTGVAVAVLLDAVGAEREAVVADYASSAENLTGPWADRMRATVVAMGVPLTPEIDELLTATPPAAIETAMSWLDERGGSASYLRSGGLTADELDSLRQRLVG